MSWLRSAAAIVAAWQTAIEQDVEAGRVPRLALGAPCTTVDSAALLALQTAAVQRTDITTPWLVCGGLGMTWMAALLSPLAGVSTAPEPAVVYGGGDDATHLATWSITAGMETAPEIAPRIHAGVSPRWDAWPLLESGEAPPGPLQERTVAPDSADDWTTWGVMLLALCLVLSAFLL